MFEEDLKFGQKCEDILLKIIRKKYPMAHRKEGYCRGYDIIIPEINIKIEVKADRLSKKTGNIAIEFGYNGKDSGIITTEADWWAIFVYSHFHSCWLVGIIEVVKLYEIAQEFAKNKATKGNSYCWVINFDKYILNNLDFIKCLKREKQ